MHDTSPFTRERYDCNAGLIGEPKSILPIQHDGAIGLQAQGRSLDLRHGFDRGRSHGGQVDAQVLVRLGSLDHSFAGQPTTPTNRLSPPGGERWKRTSAVC